MKKIIYTLFHPNKFIGIPIFVISVILLIYALGINQEKTAISYIAYLLSTYSLVLFIICFIKACKFSFNKIKSTRIYNWYDKNRNIITRYTLTISSCINLAFGIFEFAMGLYYKSWWFITFAIYYLILCYMKLFLLKGIKKFGINLKLEYKKLKNTGCTLLFLNVILTGIIILVLHQNSANTYSNNLIYGVALYDFYLIITAIVNVCKYKKNKSPIISASKCVTLSVAMISILSLEVAMIYEFGENSVNFKVIMVSCTGFTIAIINTIMSIIMIVKANNKLLYTKV